MFIYLSMEIETVSQEQGQEYFRAERKQPCAYNNLILKIYV